MKCNVGVVDRIIRAIVGILLIGIAVAYRQWWAWIGVIPLATALVAYCPAYHLLRLSTCPQHAPEKKSD